MNQESGLAFCPELLELQRSRCVRGRSGRQFERLEALSSENNLVTLYRLMRTMKPARTLEIGLSFGGSGLVFTSGHRDLGRAPGRQHVAIDPFQASVWDDCGLWAIERAGLAGYLDFRPAISSLELPRIVSEGARYDLVYIDGSHLVEDVFVDAYFVTSLLADGGVVAFDDSPDPHVRKVLRFVRSSWRAGLEEMDLGPFRPDGGATLKYRAARLLGRTQMTAFRKVGQIARPWNAPFKRF